MPGIERVNTKKEQEKKVEIIQKLSYQSYKYNLLIDIYTLLFSTLLCYERFFPGYSTFSLSSKTNILI